MEHSPVGASSAKRWLACPGSVALIQATDSGTPSKYAALGTLAHTVAEHWLEHGESLTLQKYPVDSEHETDGHVFKITEELYQGIQTFIDFTTGLFAQYPDAVFDFESKVALKHMHPNAFGTGDFILYSKANGTLVVVDYKNGSGVVVDVEENEQLLYYALAAAYSWLDPVERNNLKAIRLVVVQPNTSEDQPIKEWTTTPHYLFITFERRLREGFDKIKAGDNTLEAGEHCRFCNAKPVCPAYRDHLNASVTSVFGKELPILDYELPKPQDMTGEQIVKIMEAAKRINEWTKEVGSYALQFAKKGGTLPGYKLVKKTGNRKWKDELEAWAFFAKKLGDQVLTEPKLKSPAQLEKMLAKDERSVLDEYVIRPDCEPVLVPATSPKDAIKNVLDVLGD